MNYVVLNRDQLLQDGNVYEFQGFRYEATFTIDSTTLAAHAGQIIIVPADMNRKFMNSSDK